jgi:hypothetical protein
MGSMHVKTTLVSGVVVAAGLLIYLNLSTRRGTEPVGQPTLSQDQKMWCLAASAVLTQCNHHRHDDLAGVDRSDKEINRWMRILDDGWGVTDRGSLLETLGWIREGGHRYDFDEMAAFLTMADESQVHELERRAARDEELANEIDIVRSYAEELGDAGLMGWDYSRHISLCRWGYIVGYIDEEEAWELILPAAQTLQDNFDSWEELGRNYLIGRRYWSLEATNDNGEEYTAAYEWLCSDPGSPWKRIPWDLDLTPASTSDESAVDDSR